MKACLEDFQQTSQLMLMGERLITLKRLEELGLSKQVGKKTRSHF